MGTELKKFHDRIMDETTFTLTESKNVLEKSDFYKSQQKKASLAS